MERRLDVVVAEWLAVTVEISGKTRQIGDSGHASDSQVPGDVDSQETEFRKGNDERFDNDNGLVTRE